MSVSMSIIDLYSTESWSISTGLCMLWKWINNRFWCKFVDAARARDI